MVQWLRLLTPGLPWWLSGKESTCQCRGHGFDPWSRKISHASEQLSPCATILKPLHPKACALQQGKQPQWEAHPSWHLESSSHSPKLEKSPSTNEDPAQPKMNKIKKKRLLIPNAGGQDSIPGQGTGSYMFQIRKRSFMSQLRPGAAKKRKKARKRKKEQCSLLPAGFCRCWSMH